MTSASSNPPKRQSGTRVLKRITLIQQQGLTENRAANVAALLSAIDAEAPDADVVMPTELCTTPYFGVLRDPAIWDWAEELTGEVVRAVSERAARHRTTILLPLYFASGGKRENAVLVIDPDGQPIDGQCADGRVRPHFSKVHLPAAWRDGKGLEEQFYFTPGDAFPVFDTPAGRIGILVCYDRRFPEAWRSLALAGAEIVFVPACVPLWSPGSRASTADMFVTELRTHACENGVFVAACGRAGHQRLRHVDSHFVGLSCVIDPAGAVLDTAPSDAAARLTVDIDLAEVAKVRHRLTVLRDRRPEAYDTGEGAKPRSAAARQAS